LYLSRLSEKLVKTALLLLIQVPLSWRKIVPRGVDLSLARRKNSKAGEFMRFRVVLILTFLLCCAGLYVVAADESAAKAAAPPAKHYPDEGLLSNYRNANAFFGFSID
jgi:hypothetical protein